jgi:hypothetical protein
VIGSKTCATAFSIPSGKRFHNELENQSPFSLGKSTISMGIFNSFLQTCIGEFWWLGGPGSG